MTNVIVIGARCAQALIMTSIDPALSVAELAHSVKGAARVFEQFGIDYCCRGREPLRSAANALRLPLDDVLAALRASADQGPAPQQFDDAPSLIAHIVQHHHKPTREALQRLSVLGEKVLRVHGDKHPELGRVLELIGLISADLMPHMFKEERVLFPYIAGLAHGKRLPTPFGKIEDPVLVMEVEHEQLAVLLRELEQVTSGYVPPSGACGSYGALYAGLKELQADLHQHVHLENHLLFPMGVALERKA